MYNELLKIEGEIIIHSKSHLSEKERRLEDFIIPTSYLEFTSEMGFGLLMGLFITYIPIIEGEKVIVDSLQNQNIFMRGLFDQYLKSPLSMFNIQENIELIKYAVPFLMSENGEMVFWDSRKKIEEEYSIYLVNFPVEIYYVADNFVDFISVLSNDKTYKRVLTFHQSPLPRVFKPYNEIL